MFKTKTYQTLLHPYCKENLSSPDLDVQPGDNTSIAGGVWQQKVEHS